MAKNSSNDDEISYFIPFPNSPDSDDLVIDESSLAPVIIEELEESQINEMNVNINEFIEANPIEICEVNDNNDVQKCQQEITDDMDVDMSDGDGDGDNECDDDILSREEEDHLTKQFLNGELTFSEYSSRMDRNTDNDTFDDNINR